MKRLLLWVGVVLLIGTVFSATAGAASNNFTIKTFTADFYLSRDESGRSTLKTVEQITADFSALNQNHGLERAIPVSYDNHPTSLSIDSIVDENGQSLQYSESESDGSLRVIRIGDPDRYVSGLKTYVITYTQRDVTRYFDDRNVDEFYWDLIGTGWKVPIEQFKGTLHIDSSIASSRTGSQTCYTGAYGASGHCEITIDKAGLTMSVEGESFFAGKGMTVAVGFAPHTFEPYQVSPFEKFILALIAIWFIVQVIAVVFVIIFCTIAIARWRRRHNRTADMGTIIPEYLPPRDYSTLVSAALLSRDSMVPFLLDMAVRHNIAIRQLPATSKWSSRSEYEIELLSVGEDIKDDERSMLQLYFPSLTIGERFALKSMRNNTLFYLVLSKLKKRADPLENGLRARATKDQKSWFKVSWICLFVASILFVSPVLLMATIIVAVLSASLAPLTDQGVALRRYLEGLKQYISVAEVDRLRMLQSPEGAQKVGSLNTADPGQIVKLYERVLPYASMWGLEKQWGVQLGAYYEQASSSPDWYTGTDVFTAAAFASALNGLSSSVASATTYSSTSSSSSSSSGSGGGGFSGGGGGGGGGGGW